jgi:general stress protein 26
MDGAMEEIRKLMMEQRLAVLCTAQPDGQAYTSLVAFAASQDLKQIAFATMRATRKFANLSSNPRVALLLDDRAHQPSDLLDAAALTLRGQARAIEADERIRWTTALLAKHPTMADFLASPDCAVIVVDVDRFQLVTRFQQVTELVLRDGVLERVTAESR